MNISRIFKKIVNWLIVFLLIFLIGYIGYRIYGVAVENIAKRVRQEVSSGIIDTINPLKWPGKIFGHKRKNQGDDN